MDMSQTRLVPVEKLGCRTYPGYALFQSKRLGYTEQKSSTPQSESSEQKEVLSVLPDVLCRQFNSVCHDFVLDPRDTPARHSDRHGVAGLRFFWPSGLLRSPPQTLETSAWRVGNWSEVSRLGEKPRPTTIGTPAGLFHFPFNCFHVELRPTQHARADSSQQSVTAYSRR